MSETNVVTELIPRNYQEALIRKCVEENSIIFLPTGAGKTFIAVCALKELAKDDFSKSYSDGGKICVFIVNTVTLVQQHHKYLQQNTPFKIGTYTGDMNVDFWNKEKWLQEYNENSVLVMTAQIFKNSLTSAFIDLNKVNVLIFDECHHGVDNHPMREIMRSFEGLQTPPRVIGLTATLLNGNVKPTQVFDEVEKLETTFHSKVATVDALVNVIGYSTNPKEQIVHYTQSEQHPVISECLADLRHLEDVLREFKQTSLATPTTSPRPNMRLLKKEKPFEKYYKLLMDACIHMEMFGVAGSLIACILYTIHMELEKRTCSDIRTLCVINSLISKFAEIRDRLEAISERVPREHRIITLSTNKIHKFVQILTAFKHESNEPLCGIVFVERKNTAMFLYHLLQDLKHTYANLAYIKPDFIIGYNANPLNASTEALYYAKLNRKVIDKFNSKEVNLLIASNVIEEGIDVPMCTLVIKFDTIKDYRAYVQSKGRTRHANGLYYMMVDDCVGTQFCHQYKKYQQIEQNLHEYLIGANELRSNPSKDAIDSMYKEQRIFYVDGIGSANVTETSAMQALMMYCTSVKTDPYTTYEPMFYLSEVNAEGKFQVAVELPIFSPIKDLIYGSWCSNKKDAKRSAAFNACVQLYQVGELTKEMLPKMKHASPETIDYLFPHWPAERSKSDGNSRNKRAYEKVVPACLSTPIQPGELVYLHIFDLKPEFGSDEFMLLEMYTNDLGFGLISSEPLPTLCQFPTYVTLGCINVNVQVNKRSLTLSAEQVNLIKNFHHLILEDILGVVRSYLFQGRRGTHCCLVPVSKSKNNIDFDVLNEHQDIVDFYTEYTTEEKKDLVVDNHSYLRKIVTPYYRTDRKHHLVLRVCDDITAASPFPNEEHQSYAAYFEVKYDRIVVNENLPMLLVKPLSSSLNCLKPRGASFKRKRDETYETMVQHFIPELCIKQEFPACLWISATLLPTILHRLEQLLRAEELRATIAKEAKLGQESVLNWLPLQVDMRLINYKIAEFTANQKEDEQMQPAQQAEIKPADVVRLLSDRSINKTFNDIMNDHSYPWDPEVEPIDFTRNLDVTLLDIEVFSKFISMIFDASPENNNDSPEQRSWNKACLAIKYEPNYTHKPIALLQGKPAGNGPELRSVYEALATAKSNEIVNLERMETLGDSFLKLVASLYVFIKFPAYTEGEATELKGRLISNRNLYYLATLKRIGGLLKMNDLNTKDEWLPPQYCVPEEVYASIQNKEMAVESLFNIQFSREEQLRGELQPETLAMIIEERLPVDDEGLNNSYVSMCHYLGIHTVGDKTLADVVEALIGVYVDSMGIQGGLKLIEWLGILPKNEASFLFDALVPNPIIKDNCTESELTFQLSNFEASAIEEILGYKFRNRAFLLQALTHTSYNRNRLTLSYQRLEFIGDAVLDVLITLFIFENNPKLNPGELTDLRSALVNNETFAAYVIKLGLHRYLKHYNVTLMKHIAKFEKYQQQRKNEITSDVLILLNEDHLRIAENVDVPKVLGDLFESMAGAIFLDSGKDLDAVWRVFHKIMWREIQAFSQDIPRNPIRMLYEKLAPLRPIFSEPIDVENGAVMMKLDFVLEGTMQRVHGFGENKNNAKKAAAKIALRLLSIKRK